MTKLILIVFFTFCFWISSCSNDNPASSTGFQFGNQYSISNEPTISNDTLIVIVVYSGCGGGHLFSLKSKRISNKRIDLWLYKVTPDQQCDAIFQETLRFALSDEIIGYDQVYFQLPTGEEIPL